MAAGMVHGGQLFSSGEDNQNSPGGGFPGPATSGWSSRVKPSSLRIDLPLGDRTNRTNAAAVAGWGARVGMVRAYTMGSPRNSSESIPPTLAGSRTEAWA